MNCKVRSGVKVMLSGIKMQRLFVIILFLLSYRSFSLQEDTLLSRINQSSGVSKARLLKILYEKYGLQRPDTKMVIARTIEKIAISSNNDTVKADAYMMISKNFRDLSNYDSATSYAYKSLKFCEKIKDSNRLSDVFNSIGVIFHQLGNRERAIFYMKKAAAIKLKNKDYFKHATINVNIAINLGDLGRHSEAISLFKQSEKTIKEFNNKPYLSNLYNALAISYQNGPKNIDSAVFYYKKSIELVQGTEHEPYAMPAYRNLGVFYLSKGNLKQAEINFNKALVIAEQNKSGLQRIYAYSSLCNLFETKRDYKMALYYKVKEVQLNDSIFNKEKESVVQELEAKYELEKKNAHIKDQELTIQREKNNKIIIILISVFVIILLVTTIFYFWFSRRLEKQTKETKEKFFVNVMHEIRTPLSMIRAPLSVLKGKISDPEGINNLELAERNSQRLNDLIDQMLDISKFSNLTYKLNETVGSIDSFLAEIILDYRNIAAKSSITFISEINLLNLLVLFDKDAIYKIVTNLLSNAVKYNKAGGTIGIKVNEEKSGQVSKILIEVWDTGVGIPKKDQPKLFTRFYRSEKSSSSTKGIGIGLSLVKDLVEAHKGKIWFLSEEGIGSKFFVELSLKLQDSTPDKVNYESIENDKGLVMLVEDNKDVIDFVGNLLMANNYRVIKAVNGKIALEALKDITPDLIVTDLMMDDIDGLSFIKEIKANVGISHIPIVVLSAKTSEQTKVEVMKAGAQMYLTKPFIPDELLSVIENQLNLISTLKKEVKAKIDSHESTLTLEQKYSSQDPYAQKFFDLAFKHFENSELTTEYLADLMATNRSHFQRKIKNLTGYSPSDLLRFIRLDKSREFLLAKKGNITEVAYMSGFSTQSYFSTCFTERFGKSPSEFLKQ